MPKILVVEDEGLVSADLEFCLQGIGYRTMAAPSGEFALHVAGRSLPDLALLDICLAGSLDGIETAVLLRKRFHIGAVFLTAHADPATLARAREAVPFGYLLKPFREGDLRATMEMAVCRSRSRSGRLEPRAEFAFDLLEMGTDRSEPRE